MSPHPSATATVTELDLLTFFEVQPTLLDPATPWLYNDALYRVEREGVELSFAFAPAYLDVRIILQQSGATVYELNATGVQDVRYHVDGGRELLEVVVSDRDRLLLRLKPAVSIHQTCNPPDGVPGNR